MCSRITDRLFHSNVNVNVNTSGSDNLTQNTTSVPEHNSTNTRENSNDILTNQTKSP